MRDLIADIDRWRTAGRRVAVATLVRVWGSAPRRPGARMAVSSDGEICGSVSGGCVESAVAEEARQVLTTGVPRTVEYGVTDDRAWEVGLSCGGSLEVFVAELRQDAIDAGLRRILDEQRPVALVTRLSGAGIGRQRLVPGDAQPVGDLGSAALNAWTTDRARALLPAGGAERVQREGPDGSHDLFLETFPPTPRLIVVGAVHLAIPLVELARATGLRTVVVDPRRALATRQRFAQADEIVPDWPEPAFARLRLNETTAVAVLSHDDKIDVPALSAALRSRAGYVGALGSRRTFARRAQALRRLGHDEEAIARIHAPIGLDLGGRQPEEIAVAILAQIVAVRNRASDRGTRLPHHGEES
jgi:xanthine dehydrogenase accessory factor